MRNIIKKEEATPKQFLGVDFVVLSIGENSMVTKMLYKITDFVAFVGLPQKQQTERHRCWCLAFVGVPKL
ncbi:hypothetical protein [Terrimonas pollutisoli]|uniref:hypothetical protein n=1 Tax=Terrimonas pollutisoli TaxID=3034147 RepID=UPI0023EAF809|nr:hypothetical protein [Terrimonas sp. H1YJ31]